MAATHPVVERGFNPTRIDTHEVLSRTWQIVKQNFVACLASALIYLVLSLVAYLILGFGLAVAMSNLEGVTYVAAWLVQQILLQAVVAFLTLGMIAFMLKIARGEPTDFAEFFSGGKWIVFGVAIQLITGLAVMGGVMLLIVPGIIIGLMLSQALFMLVDQGTDIAGSLKRSVEAMHGNKWTLFYTYFVAGFGGWLITAITCGLGSLLVVPYMALLPTVIYLGVTGQKTVLDDLEQPAVERGFGPGGA